MAKKNSRATGEFNRAAASTDNYIRTNLNIKSTDDETRNVISSTFGVIKNNILQAFWSATGLDSNVNTAYEQSMTDPSQSFEANGKRYFVYPGGVGKLQAYNELGNPADGCFTMQVIG